MVQSGQHTGVELQLWTLLNVLGPRTYFTLQRTDSRGWKLITLKQTLTGHLRLARVFPIWSNRMKMTVRKRNTGNTQYI